MAREFERSQRVASQLRRELTELLQREVEDPRVQWVTIIDIEVSRDLSVAKVYISTLQKEKLEETLTALQELAPGLRRLLGKRLHLRTIPELQFLKETALERGMRIAQLLDQLKKDEGDG